MVDSALSQAGLSAAQLDAVAVTVGPGLSLCLDVGVRKARELSRQNSLPLVPVHHMEVQGGGWMCMDMAGGNSLLWQKLFVYVCSIGVTLPTSRSWCKQTVEVSVSISCVTL